MQIHAQNSHENDKSFKCGVCQTTFADKAKLIVHTTQVHGSKTLKSDLESECNICKKTFPKSSINRHISEVHEESNVNCKVCYRQFGTMRTLEFHMKTFHSLKDNFKCLLSDCEKEFTRKTALESHVKNVHELIPPSSPTRFPYPCLWNLGVGEAGPKNVGEAENLRF